ncbi:hypothetical protein [Spirosoma luteum]|uniref:hypothetical protein n=1 Tax=Spirosoma luteum TaxID=431553 RepID=UPI00037B0D8D|nr:hypothetical protein [Spirosoma luteum]
MKYHTFILLFICSSVAFGQEEKKSLIGTYYWINSVVLEAATLDGKPDTQAKTVTSIPNQYFKVIKETKNDDKDWAIIEIIPYNKGVENFYEYNVKGGVTAYNSLSNEKKTAGEYTTVYFRVEPSIVRLHAAQRIPASFVFGLINFPFKFRPQYGRNDFAGAFNFGAGLGYKLGHKGSVNTTVTIINAYSLSNINIDAPAVTRNSADLEKTNNYSGLSISLGLMAENKRVQAGIFTGIDILSNVNQTQFGWHYQGKPWISIGFGYSIFSNDKPSEETVAKQPNQKP